MTIQVIVAVAIKKHYGYWNMPDDLIQGASPPRLRGTGVRGA